MRRRRLLGAGAVVLLGVAGFGSHWLTKPTPGVTLENFLRLRVGMLLEDVQKLIETPPVSQGTWNSYSSRLWQASEIKIYLTFDLEQRLSYGVVGVPGLAGGNEYLRPAEETLLDRIRRWLHL